MMNTGKRINWVDGMLLNKKHFKGLEDYLLSNVYATNRFVTDQGYGIMNDFNGDKDYPYIHFSVDSSDSKNQKVIFERLEFCALTISGTIIDVANENFHYQKAGSGSIIVDVEEQKISHGDPLYVVMLIQPYDTVGTGDADGSAEPLRSPNCVPLAKLKCVNNTSANENIVGSNHFPIAKIKIINNRLEIDNNYIPPVLNSAAHSAFGNWVSRLKTALLELSNNFEEFIRTNQDVGEPNISFMSSVYFTLYPHLIGHLAYFSDKGNLLTPREIFRSIKSFAMQFKKLLLCNSEAYTFFTEAWNAKYGVNFHNFSSEIDRLDKVKYYDVVESLEVCDCILGDFFLKITSHSGSKAGDILTI